ncbi:MAG: recombination protein RecR [Spirochaetales bacterium]|nr:recombination protein RecR [Spirochaetales bacterium]MBO6049151.1 recombination protein RecR [Spirochaetales bacterium]MBO7349922.1 recombination protein RecR [Spirochaetales bacterium]MBP5756041.1 recombination protein RecR [Spirochaetales bacterium]
MTALENLSKLLSRLPGVGPKSASRIAFSLINTPKDYNDLLAQSIAEIKDKVRPCSICGSFTETEICPVCSDSMRDRTQLCIVEQPQDVLSIQASGAYNGLFHVLGGAINPLNGVGPENLSFSQLLKRIDEGSFKEIIIATNPTEEGDTTALYIRHILKDREGLTLSRLASGLPIGGDLEYADRTTLTRSFRGRISF